VLLQRYGVITREVAAAERVSGGFSALYGVFKALEEAGRIRRGYFVSGVSAMQFAAPGVLEQLRNLRRAPEIPEAVVLAATDPANPYGALIKWPSTTASGRSPARAAHALVILVDGALAAYVTRGARQVQVFLPEAEPDRTRFMLAIAGRLRAIGSLADRRGLLIGEIDGAPAEAHVIAPHLRAAGFSPSYQGYYLPRTARDSVTQLPAADDLDAPEDSETDEALDA
jgi:ATP-dependent Lhr-like helicase